MSRDIRSSLGCDVYVLVHFRYFEALGLGLLLSFLKGALPEFRVQGLRAACSFGVEGFAG